MINKLSKLRKQIDSIDKKIVKLLNSRAEIAQEIGKIKKKSASSVYVPKREQEVLENVVSNSSGVVSNKDLKTIYKKIMLACKHLED